MKPAVLVIDDDPQILQAIRRLLHREGYEVLLAESGPRALEILREREVAVVICDQRMPGMSGPETLAQAVVLRPDTFRITFTGHSDLQALQSSINEGGVNHFLLKPWNDEHLLKAVGDGVTAYELIQDHRRLEALAREQKAELEAWNQQLEQQVLERTAEIQARNENLLELRHRLEQSLRDTVGVLASMLEAHSASLGIHSRRVAELARQLGLLLNVQDEDLRDVEFAAHLHDIGRISRLHSSEWARGQGHGTRAVQAALRHPDCGYAILSHVSGFENIAWAVRYQQERFDGTGHPEGLRGDAIPLASRIIAVVNAYDEAVFPVANPTGVSRDAGRQALLKGRGHQFDPRPVELLLQYLDDLGVNAGADAEVELSPKQIVPGMVLSRPIKNLDGVLLLPEGTTLGPELIDRIKNLSAVDPLVTRVFVCCGSEPQTGDAKSETAEAGSQARCNGPDSSFRSPVAEETRNSEPETEGSTPVQRSSPSVSGLQSGISRKLQVLVVDDSRLIRSALLRELRRTDCEGIAASDGYEALDLLKTARFDVATVDLAMPSLPGVDLVNRLREVAPDMPCIIVTGNATREEVLKLAGAPNVAGILVKPWDYDRLIAVIRAAIAKRRPALAQEVTS